MISSRAIISKIRYVQSQIKKNLYTLLIEMIIIKHNYKVSINPIKQIAINGLWLTAQEAANTAFNQVILVWHKETLRIELWIQYWTIKLY